MDGKDQLLTSLLDANKRLANILAQQRHLGAKLFGPHPQNETGRAGDTQFSVSSLTDCLLTTIAEIESELQAQHSAVGDLNAPAQGVSSPQYQGTRAVGY